MDQPSDPKMYLPAEPGTKPGLKVIVAGMPRNATSSLVMALNELGFGPSHHVATLMNTPKTAGLWIKAWDAHFEGRGEMTKADWDELLDGFWSVADNPAHAFADVLADLYPDAKIILNYRDTDGWCTSIINTIMPLSNSLPAVVRYLDISRRQVWALFHRMHHHPNFNMEVAARSHDTRRTLARMYDQHYAYMERVLPSDRTVKWKVQDGWEPICELLGVPVPDHPFPHAYDSKTFGKNSAGKMQKFARAGIMTLVSGIFVAVAAVATPVAYKFLASNF